MTKVHVLFLYVIFLHMSLFGFDLANASEVKTNVTLIIDQHILGGGHQVALLFEPKRVQKITNSNFLLAPSEKVRLGIFESKYNEELNKIQTTLLAAKKLLEANKNSKLRPAGLGPHDIEIKVSGRYLDPKSQTYKDLIELYKKIEAASYWTPVDAIEAEKYSESAAKIKYIGKKDTTPGTMKCDKTKDGELLCSSRQFGYAMFAP